jgi:transcriptional regulator with XRE-family HTH domain
MDDQRVGAVLRRLRIARQLRQTDLAALAGVPRKVVIDAEAGRLDGIAVGRLRRLARLLGARFEGDVLWHGGDRDRMLNRGHAAMHEAVVRWLREIGGWLALPEISFARNGERGVIDIVAWHPATRSVLVIELKTRLVDLNNLMATMDIRRRVAWDIARDHGWDPLTVSIWVIAAPSRTNARILADHRTVLRAKFPADGRTMRGSLADPQGAVAALSFLPQVRVPNLGRDLIGPRRVRRPRTRTIQHTNEASSRREPRIGVAFRE